MSDQINVMLVGISGVGKTTFLREVSSNLVFQHLTAGTLISASAQQKRDELRLSDIGDNQRHLIDGFKVMRDQNAEVVVLDGHSVIDTGRKLFKIETHVFKELGVSGIVHLEATPEKILNHRTADASRGRPLLSIEVLSNHQKQSFDCAANAAHTIGVPFLRLTNGNVEDFIDFVDQIRRRKTSAY